MVDTETYVRNYITKCRGLGYTDQKIQETLVKYNMDLSLVSRLLQEGSTETIPRGSGIVSSVVSSKPFYTHVWFFVLIGILFLGGVLGGVFFFTGEEFVEEDMLSENKEDVTATAKEKTKTGSSQSSTKKEEAQTEEEEEESNETSSEKEEVNYIIASLSLASLDTSSVDFVVTVANDGGTDAEDSSTLFCGLYDADDGTEWAYAEVSVDALRYGESSEVSCSVDTSVFYASLEEGVDVTIDFFVWADANEEIEESDDEDNYEDYLETWNLDSFSEVESCSDNSECEMYLCDTENSLCYDSCTENSVCAEGYACASDYSCSEDVDADGLADVDACAGDEDCEEGFVCDLDSESENYITCVEEEADTEDLVACADGEDNDSDGYYDYSGACTLNDGSILSCEDELFSGLDESDTCESYCDSQQLGYLDPDTDCTSADADSEEEESEEISCSEEDIPSCANGEDDDGDGYVDYAEEVGGDCTDWEDTEDDAYEEGDLFDLLEACEIDSQCESGACSEQDFVCVECEEDSACSSGICGDFGTYTEYVCIECEADTDCVEGSCSEDGECVSDEESSLLDIGDFCDGDDASCASGICAGTSETCGNCESYEDCNGFECEPITQTCSDSCVEGTFDGCYSDPLGAYFNVCLSGECVLDTDGDETPDSEDSEECADSLDNEGDGDVDCDDSDCSKDSACEGSVGNGDACDEDSDCASGICHDFLSNDLRCAECEDDEPCGGYICDSLIYYCYINCSDSSECAAGYSCENEECVVASAEDENSAPTVSIDDVTLTEGETLSISASGSDADGDSLSYSFSGISGSSSDASFMWQTSSGDAGTYTLEVEVSDGTDTASDTATISVEAAVTSESNCSDGSDDDSDGATDCDDSDCSSDSVCAQESCDDADCDPYVCNSDGSGCYNSCSSSVGGNENGECASGLVCTADSVCRPARQQAPTLEKEKNIFVRFLDWLIFWD